MYPYNEDAAWTRLQDIQREMENSRVWAQGMGSVLWMAKLVLARAWHLAGLAATRAPRRRPELLEKETAEPMTRPAA
jgi:hypothetical protein